MKSFETLETIHDAKFENIIVAKYLCWIRYFIIFATKYGNYSRTGSQVWKMLLNFSDEIREREQTSSSKFMSHEQTIKYSRRIVESFENAWNLLLPERRPEEARQFSERMTQFLIKWWGTIFNGSRIFWRSLRKKLSWILELNEPERKINEFSQNLYFKWDILVTDSGIIRVPLTRR